jgi:sporulation protein YunB
MRWWIRRFFRILLLVLLVAAVLLLLLRRKYDAVMVELTKTQVTNATSDLINDAIAQQIASGRIAYDRIVYFEKDLAGKITALKTNIGEVNKLKTDTLNLINDEILSNEHTQIGIPLGSLFLPELLSGKGPEIPVKILSIRNSDGSFKSYFSEAGINQTLQQLTMDVTVDVSVLVLGKAESFTVSSQVVVAETIIVGQVPNTYLQTGGEHGSITENP